MFSHLSFSLKMCLGLLLLGCGFFWYSVAQYQWTDYCTHGDLLQQAFCAAKQRDTIIDLGNTKNAVGNAVIRWSTEINISIGKGGIKAAVEKKGSILIRATQFILTLTIVLAVTMIILNGIQYIIKSGSGEDPSKARTNLILIVAGIILALSSVMIINLLRSVGEGTWKQEYLNIKKIWYYHSTSYLSLV